MLLDLSDWMQRVYFLGAVENDKVKLMRSIIPADGVFIDIGANVGLFTCVMGTYLEAGQVIAYEPNPENIASLQSNIALNSLTNVTVMPFAAGEESATLPLFVPHQHPGGPTAASKLGPVDDGWREVGTVNVVTLDQTFTGNRLDLVKIDVECHEARVLAGGTEVFRRFRPAIVCEVSTVAATAAHRFAEAMDYSVRHLGPYEVLLRPL